MEQFALSSSIGKIILIEVGVLFISVNRQSLAASIRRIQIENEMGIILSTEIGRGN